MKSLRHHRTRSYPLKNTRRPQNPLTKWRRTTRTPPKKRITLKHKHAPFQRPSIHLSRIPSKDMKMHRRVLRDTLTRKNRPRIRSLFNFHDWTQLDMAQVTPIGEKSNNGFVLKLPFRSQNYTAYTVLKSSTTKWSDNLMYEYLVGTQFVNSMCDKFPCFLETYSLQKYKHPGFLYATKSYTDGSIPRFQSIPFRDMMSPVHDVNPHDWKLACKDGSLFAIMIQYFDNVKSLSSAVKDDFDDVKYDMPQILYQVYYVLTQLADSYTHYDLHGKNVLLYKPFDGNVYMRMHYHQSDGTVLTFCSEWIAKLIDYGRNFFKTKDTSSMEIIKSIVRTPECEDAESTMYIKGKYGPLSDSHSDTSGASHLDSYIDPTEPNISHDLQLLRYFPNFVRANQMNIKDIDKKDLDGNQVFGFPSTGAKDVSSPSKE